MRHRSRYRAAILASLVLIPGALYAEAKTAVPESDTEGVTVEITVTNLRNGRGMVRACMTDEPDLFPRCDEGSGSFHASAPADGAIAFRFADVQPGKYAIALLHDENGNGKVDKTLIMPREGFGFSRDAAVRMGPPSFSAAAFVVGVQPVHQVIRMRYLL